MAASSDLTPSRSRVPAMHNLSPISNDSLQVQAVYAPIVAIYRTRREYTVPAIRVMPGKGGAEMSVFPLSQEEIGEIWTTADELGLWEFVPVIRGRVGLN